MVYISYPGPESVNVALLTQLASFVTKDESQLGFYYKDIQRGSHVIKIGSLEEKGQ